MTISRRNFLGYCVASAAALKLSSIDLFNLRAAFANPAGPKVLWIHGSGCSGCSISFLNRVPEDSDALYSIPGVSTVELLTGSSTIANTSVNLIYHATLMSAAGETASSALLDVAATGNYVLIAEGGVATAFGGACSIPWSRDGQDVTFEKALNDLASRALSIVAFGTCAAYGGVSASGSNVPGVVSVSQALPKKNVVNISGCPPHPNWMVWAIAKLLGNGGTWPSSEGLDSYNRPLTLYGKEIHANCPRNNASTPHAAAFGVDNQCLIKLGCNGPGTYSPCPAIKWNDGSNWCIDANANCLGCVQPTFPNAPGNPDFYTLPR